MLFLSYDSFTTTDKVYYESNSEPMFTYADETPSYLFCLYKAFLPCIFCFCFFIIWGRHGRDRMGVWLATTYAIFAYHH